MTLFSGSVLIILILAVSLVCGSSVGPSSAEEIIDVEYCKLIKDAAVYHNNLVRTNAVFATGFEHSFLYNSACRGNGAAENRVWVILDDSPEKPNQSKVIEEFDRLLRLPEQKPGEPVDKFRSRRVEVQVVGRFESDPASVRYGHLGGYDYQLTVYSIEKVKAVPEDARW